MIVECQESWDPYEQDVITMRSQGITYKKYTSIYVRKAILEQLLLCECLCRRKEPINVVWPLKKQNQLNIFLENFSVSLYIENWKK